MRRIWLLSAFALGGLALGLLASCTRINPLDEPVPAPPGPIAGQITVNVLNGTTPTAAGIAVQVTGPNGDPIVQDTVAVPSGQVIFNVAQQGAYSVGLANQPSALPAFQTVVLSGSHTYANVTLQESGAFLSATPIDGKGNSFTGFAETHIFSVAYQNNTALQQDLVMSIDSSGLPIGWSSSFSNNYLNAGGTTTLTINTGQLTSVSTVGVPILGLVKGVAVISQGVALSKNWSISMGRCYSYSAGGCTQLSHQPFYCNFTQSESYQINAVNCSPAIFTQCALTDVYTGDTNGTAYVTFNGGGSGGRTLPTYNDTPTLVGTFGSEHYQPLTHSWVLTANGVLLLSATDAPLLSVPTLSGGSGNTCY